MKDKKKKSVKVPKPIKVKKEKNELDKELQPMSFYIDDRLELVKQVFNTLKPKTITNLAPDFLKKNKLRVIQEKCLNELLGMSKKRLLSVINATKCPSDTDTTDDSDVELEKGHISLEEISSDSEVESSTSAAAKKKLAKAGTGAKKDAKKSAKTGDVAPPTGEISVLELLELQARARAIRSQLALEPVTKIEVVDDEDDEPGGKSTAVGKQMVKPKLEETVKGKTAEKSKNKKKKNGLPKEKSKIRKASKDGKSARTKHSSSNGHTTESGPAQNGNSGKPIKLMRKFPRLIISEKLQQSSPSTSSTTTTNSTTSPTVKKEHSSRSSSPDVIPIVPEPVVLEISDSSDEEEQLCPPQDAATASKPTTNAAMSESEEGEITDTEGEAADNPVDSSKTSKVDGTRNDAAEMGEICAKGAAPPQEQPSQPTAAIQAEQPTTVPAMDENDDNNDDVISLVGDDLDNELTAHLNDDSCKFLLIGEAKEGDESNTAKAVNCITLDSSEEEQHAEKEQENWRSRYLKSSKVSKVLATSRLGKRVRDKLKSSKQAAKKAAGESDSVADEMQKSKELFTSMHEDGSVEQYKELLERQQQQQQQQKPKTEDKVEL